MKISKIWDYIWKICLCTAVSFTIQIVIKLGFLNIGIPAENIFSFGIAFIIGWLLFVFTYQMLNKI